MARIVITRPNGETEYAALTTDKAQAGNDRLSVNKDGTTYYAKLDNGVSTHMFVIKPDGRKLYVQKEVAFKWRFVVNEYTKIEKVHIPRGGQYHIYIHTQVYNYYGDEITNTTVKKLARFTYGDHFILHEKFGWYITDTTGERIYAIAESIREDDEDPHHRRYRKRIETITAIEYIGDA